MKNLIEQIVKEIVDNPEQVVINEQIIPSTETSKDSYIYTITVAQEDLGLIIGKQGKTIKSIRSIAKVKAIKENYYVDVRVEDTNPKTIEESEINES